MFVVIEILRSYDLIEKVSYVKAFHTKEEADDHIKEYNETRESNRFQKINYIKDFVNKIEVPDSPKLGEWKLFLEGYPKYFSGRVSPKEFKSTLIYQLINTPPGYERPLPPKLLELFKPPFYEIDFNRDISLWAVETPE